MNTRFIPATDSAYELAPSTDSQPIPCDYQGHPFWDRQSPLCLSLHLIFVKYAATHRRLSGYALRQAIKLFFDFAKDFNERNPESLRLNHLTDISAEVFNNFRTYLLTNGEKKNNASKLKSAITLVSKETDLLPQIHLSAITGTAAKSTPPITGETYEMLVGALCTHVDSLYEKLAFREKVAAAEPYLFEDVIQTYTPNHTRENIFKWAQYRRDTKQKITSRFVEDKIKHSNDPELLALLDAPEHLIEFNKLYEARPDCYRFESPTDPFVHNSLWHWDPDESRVLKTLLTHGYPMDVSLETIATTYAPKYLVSRGDCQNIVQLMLFRWNRIGAKRLIQYPVRPWDDVLGAYYPTMVDMACIILFCMLQSNWNKESVLAVDGDNMEHPLTGAACESQVILQSEKNRSQGNDKPYYAPKDVITRSNRHDKYSVFNLLKLAEKLSKPLVGYEFDVRPFGQEKVDYNDMFLCLRYYGSWPSKGGRHTAANNLKAFTRGVKDFLTLYPVYEKGERLKSAKDITKRLRPTWALFQRKENKSGLGLLAMQMHHEDPSTTDISYDSSGAAVQERFERLASEQEAILDLLRKREFSGLLGEKQAPVIDVPMKVFHIPGHELPLWSCANQRRPTWSGARHHVKEGERCYSIKNCLFCEQCMIHEESLPYLMQRRIHVTELIEDRLETDSDYSDDLETESSIISSILEEWNDDDAIKWAARYERRNPALLPRDLDFLQLIFEEEDMK